MEIKEDDKRREDDLQIEQKALIKKNIQVNRRKIIADVILIIVILGIAFYVYTEIESFKMLGKDICRLCEDKTGGICSMGNYVPNVDYSNFTVNLNEPEEQPRD